MNRSLHRYFFGIETFRISVSKMKSGISVATVAVVVVVVVAIVVMSAEAEPGDDCLLSNY